MTPTTPRYPRLVSAACLAIAVVAVTAAARTPRPAPFPRATPTSRVASPALVAAPPTPVTQAPQPTKAPAPPPELPATKVMPPVPSLVVAPAVDTLTAAQVRQMIADHQPAAIVGDPGSTKVTLVVDASGAYVTSFAEAGTIVIEGRGGSAGGGGRGARGSAGADAVNGSVVGESRARGGSAPSDSGGVTHVQVMKTTMSLPRYMIDYTAKESGLSETQLQMPGFNIAVLGKLTDLSAVASVRLRTFLAGEVGSGPLYVYVVQLRR